MIALGEFAAWIALPVAIWGAVMGFAGGKQGRGDLVLSAERSVYAVFALVTLASAALIYAFMTDAFQYWYVYNYSSRELDPFFKFSGLWAGQRGSLLFWALNLAFFSAITVWMNRAKNREFMPWVSGILLSVLAFFLTITLFITPPFEQLAFTPTDGRGLNPQLQNYWMTIHPPTLYLGFTAFTVPFAFGLASLLSGRLDARWIQLTRKWILTSWFFLSVGIIFGMRWAYEELGWGGYWFWDPVENASLLPWLTATAFLHSIMIQENRGMLKVWNMSLLCLTFLLTIFATFLTRSGLIESVHSFAQDLTIAFTFLGFMAVVGAICAALIWSRRKEMVSERQFESFFSRESAFLLNNLVLLGAAFAVTWGTLFPLLTEGLTGSKVAVGPPFFNQVNIPIGLVLLALMGIGPVIAWRRASRRNLRKNFIWPTVIGLGVFLALLASGMRHMYALLTFSIAAFVLFIIVNEFVKGTRARARIEGENPFTAFIHLVRRNRRRWGGYIVHIGVVIMFVGFGGAAFDQEVRQSMEPGDTVEIQSPFGHTYSLRYDGLSTQQGQNMWQMIALFSVEKDGVPDGTITTERRLYTAPPQPVTQVGIRSTLGEDLYVILSNLDEQVGIGNNPDHQRATFQILVNPLVPWIWYGGLVLALGTLIALWPGAGSAPSRAVAAGGAGGSRRDPDPDPDGGPDGPSSGPGETGPGTQEGPDGGPAPTDREREPVPAGAPS
ncbi:MAG: heme lyase CcmF/NrfE family subunit [Gemmatimonadales bacterium]|nr:MAG: heme lyase CcmF/NrfE family subunit [Gemmatimonadales bacterium]